MIVKCVAPTGDHCGEAATWSPDEGVLYWVDVNRFLVRRLTPSTGAVEAWHFEEPCVALFLTDEPGLLLLALGARAAAEDGRGEACKSGSDLHPAAARVGRTAGVSRTFAVKLTPTGTVEARTIGGGRCVV